MKEEAAETVEALVAEDIRRGTMRLLAELEAPAIAEFALRGGRRLDLMALARDGSFTAIEIKSSRRDFLSDRKWRDYLPHADRLFFAVAADFPLDLLPTETGLIIADRFEAQILRPAPTHALPAARRKALTLRFARTAAARLMGLADPGPEDGMA